MEYEFEIMGGDFNRGGMASSKIKKVLKQINIDPKSIKKIIIALYEAEMNIVAHASRGILKVLIKPDSLFAEFEDEGPGIENIEKAMVPGFSTASKKVREMGFGAGMGLPNIKKNTDEFFIESVPGKGTRLTFTNYYE